MSGCVAAEQSKERSNIDVRDNSLIEGIVNKYNKALVFGPSEDKMAYTIRDPLTSGLYFYYTMSKKLCKLIFCQNFVKF